MKSFDSSDSLGALISICPPKDDDEEQEEKNTERNRGYSKEFQAMLDSLEQEDYCGDEFTAAPGKKRRLRSEQVKALERYFEVENKLEPERKAKLADELGLQPRQVAIWFQNRRARWKTKQLERDYGLLKANYNSLKLSFQDLHQQNQALTNTVRQLKEKANRGEISNEEISSESVKEEPPTSENNNNNESIVNVNALDLLRKNNSSDGGSDRDEDYNYDDDEQKIVIKSGVNNNNNIGEEDGSLKFSLGLNGSSSSSSSSSSSNSLMANNNWQFRVSESKACQTRIEEQFMTNHMSPFGSDEPNCNSFFSVDQAPTLYWYFPEQ